MLEIVVATLLFSGIVLLLVVVLMLAQSRLVPAGEAVLMLNGDPGRTMKAQVGSTLLGALAGHQVLIPSACGGKGTCGLCKVTVTAGGGALLPTETGFIGAREARRGVRLACQLKVKGDLSIQLAPELLDVRKWQCRVMSNRNVATFIKELKLALPAGEDVPFRAGGYVQIECPAHSVAFRDFDIDAQFRDVWDRFDLWRFVSRVHEPLMRAYSMANYPDEKGILMFTIRIAFPPDYREDIPPGAMSSWLFHLKPGDAVTVSGPFGEFFARDTEREMCFIGGGAGMAPMRAHIFDQFKRLHTRRRVSFWYGARSLREAFYSEEFEAIAAAHPNFSWHLALSEPLAEDAWTGPVGFIHDMLYRDYLAQHPAPEDIEYYICGPGAMNRAVIAMLLDQGVERENIMLDDFG